LPSHRARYSDDDGTFGLFPQGRGERGRALDQFRRPAPTALERRDVHHRPREKTSSSTPEAKSVPATKIEDVVAQGFCQGFLMSQRMRRSLFGPRPDSFSCERDRATVVVLRRKHDRMQWCASRGQRTLASRRTHYRPSRPRLVAGPIPAADVVEIVPRTRFRKGKENVGLDGKKLQRDSATKRRFFPPPVRYGGKWKSPASWLHLQIQIAAASRQLESWAEIRAECGEGDGRGARTGFTGFLRG